MSILRKITRVEKVFETLEKEVATFQTNSHLKCLKQCGHCCTKPDIEASVLEFLPFAYYSFEQGKSEEILELLSNKPSSSLCILFTQFNLINKAPYTKGYCSNYKNRGLICRLFGYAASRDKEGNAQLVTCKLIKENQQDKILKVKESLSQNGEIPIFSDYYKKLVQIDFKLAQEFLPINLAIKRALMEVHAHYAYRPFRPRKPTAA